MASKQLSEFEKGQIVAYNDSGLWFNGIIKKLNHYSLIDVFYKNFKKTGNYYQKESCGHQRKSIEDPKIVKGEKWQHTVTSQINDKLKSVKEFVS